MKRQGSLYRYRQESSEAVSSIRQGDSFNWLAASQLASKLPLSGSWEESSKVPLYVQEGIE
jgi:hypothetical protein